MVVFSDLDRSIIYSKKFISEKNDLLDIEIYNGENISYISKKTIELIEKIKSNSYFIPTTTRTIEQFKRIDFKKYKIDFKYAITSNGGHILIDGEIDKSYKLFVNDKLNESATIEEAINLFYKYDIVEGVKKFKVAEDIFFYLVVDMEKIDMKRLDVFAKNLEDLKWKTYTSGRKIYFLPNELKKSTAVNYICEKFGYKNTFSIGDSTMDEDMLDFCKYSYILKHGDLINNLKNTDKFKISEKEGFLGSEEILRDIILCQNNINLKNNV